MPRCHANACCTALFSARAVPTISPAALMCVGYTCVNPTGGSIGSIAYLEAVEATLPGGVNMLMAATTSTPIATRFLTRTPSLLDSERKALPVQLPDVNGVYQHLEDRGTTGVPAEFSTSPLRSLDPTTAEWTAVFKTTPRLEPGPCDRQSDDVEVRASDQVRSSSSRGAAGLQRPFGLARQSEAHILESCREHFRGLIWGDRLPWAKDDRQWPSSDGDWYPGDQWTTKPGRIPAA